MDLLEWLKAVDLITGLMLTAMGGVLGLIYWLARQRRGISQEITNARAGEAVQLNELSSRVSALEVRMDRTATKADLEEIDDRLDQAGDQLGRIEATVARLAERDVALTEHIQQINMRVQLIYEALLRREGTA